jgi:hypothetical protein
LQENFLDIERGISKSLQVQVANGVLANLLYALLTKVGFFVVLGEINFLKNGLFLVELLALKPSSLDFGWFRVIELNVREQLLPDSFNCFFSLLWLSIVGLKESAHLEIPGSLGIEGRRVLIQLSLLFGSQSQTALGKQSDEAEVVIGVGAFDEFVDH